MCATACRNSGAWWVAFKLRAGSVCSRGFAVPLIGHLAAAGLALMIWCCKDTTVNDHAKPHSRRTNGLGILSGIFSFLVGRINM